MPELHTSDLSRYVADADAAPGGYGDKQMVARYEPIELLYDTIVDQTLSPYSDEYFDQQMALYSEISGRVIDQESGELHADDTAMLRDAPNPTGIREPHIIAEYVRCVASMLTLCCLEGQSTILDMGAGHGLGSEVAAYTGCKVHAVDIDPSLGDLSRARAGPRNLDITRYEMNFDDLSQLNDGQYDAAIFFQSLHHCLRPWKLISDLKTKLGVDGVIAFVGEPIQNIWWKDWGLRLDPPSLYVARARGWFESGWSYDFIRDCFERNGFHLTFFTGGFYGDEIGVATISEKKRQDVINYATKLGFQQTRSRENLNITVSDFASQTGEQTTLLGRAAFRQVSNESGALVHGPYAHADPGRYEVSMLVKQGHSRKGFRDTGRMTVDISHSSGQNSILRKKVGSSLNHHNIRLIRFYFNLVESVDELEVRVFVGQRTCWTVSIPTLRKI